jgi:hypothetical protein
MTTGAAQQGSNNLGISGKSINRPIESRTYSAKSAGLPVSETAENRAGKYTLLRTAGSLLHDHAKSAAEQHRTCWCQRGVVHPGGKVAVFRRADGQGARLAGVTTCRSVWACPVCSAKICAARQAELGQALKAWIQSGQYCDWTPGAAISDAVHSKNYVWLMTLTFPHESGAVLADLMARFGKAKAHFKNSKTYKRILAKNVRRGSVTSLEITAGEHGWHPHQHDLVFATSDAFGEVHQVDDQGRITSALIAELKAQWYTSLRKTGLCEQDQMNSVIEHGLDVRGGQYAAEYIAKFGSEQKWGLSREVTMHAAKTGTEKNGGAHPFQLLAWAGEGDGQAAAQFREYAEAFEGKRMLSWSRGLKKELTGTEELTDEEAAEQAAPEEAVVGDLDAAGLSVLHARKLLANFIAYVATHCDNPDTAQADIDDYLEWARMQDRQARGNVKQKMHFKGFTYTDAEKEFA